MDNFNNILNKSFELIKKSELKIDLTINKNQILLFKEESTEKELKFVYNLLALSNNNNLKFLEESFNEYVSEINTYKAKKIYKMSLIYPGFSIIEHFNSIEISQDDIFINCDRDGNVSNIHKGSSLSSIDIDDFKVVIGRSAFEKYSLYVSYNLQKPLNVLKDSDEIFKIINKLKNINPKITL